MVIESLGSLNKSYSSLLYLLLHWPFS
jgi:hypothetical protein